MIDQIKYSLGFGGIESLTHCWKNAKMYNWFKSQLPNFLKLNIRLPSDSDIALGVID